MWVPAVGPLPSFLLPSEPDLALRVSTGAAPSMPKCQALPTTGLHRDGTSVGVSPPSHGWSFARSRCLLAVPERHRSPCVEGSAVCSQQTVDLAVTRSPRPLGPWLFPRPLALFHWLHTQEGLRNWSREEVACMCVHRPVRWREHTGKWI